MRGTGPIIVIVACLLISLFIVDLYYDILQVPFFWDELGVYSRAAIHQFVHGVSVLPASTPDVLSRGHPLLSTAYFGLIFKVFGVSVKAARISAFVLFTIITILSYKWLSHYTEPWKAILLSVAISIQPVFLAQSFLVFPEQMLLLFTLAALLLYKKQKIELSILAISCALLVKESALVLPIAFALGHYYKTKNIKISLSLLGYPIGVFLVFLIVQRFQNGYFLYPLHTSLMQFNIDIIWYNFLQSLHFIFIYQGRYWIWLSLVGIYALTHQKEAIEHLKKAKPFQSVLFWLVLGGILFASINYYLPRYIQYWMLPLMGFYMVKGTIKAKPYFTVLVFLICLSNAVFLNNNQKAFQDTDFSYVQHTRAIQSGLDKANKLDSTKTFAYNWPIVMSNWVDQAIFPKLNHKVSMLEVNKINENDYVILNIPGEPNRTQIPKSFAAIDSAQVGYAKVIIFEKKD
jgi:4-amino-4-deoxy-L-arabinose transferase-like glycosyltransferase